MKLNSKIPGLPHWPFIESVEGKNEFVVHGDHVTMRRRELAWIILVLMGTAFFFFCLALACGENSPWPLLILFLPYAVIASLVPFSWLLARYGFPCKRRIRFTQDAILIDSRSYTMTPHLNIQFRANRSPLREDTFHHLSQLQASGKSKAKDELALSYRLVEMVYGAQLIPVTVIADKLRAEQYALALQAAHDLLWSHHSVTASPGPRDSMRDTLPE